MSPPLKYEGSALFRQRIVSATLSGNLLRISHIRESNTITSKGSEFGLQAAEASFLQLIEKITDGCRIEINETGTSLRYRPGILQGGSIQHDCGTTRSIGWFIEGIIPLAVFCKEPLKLILTGITNDSIDLSVDTIRNVTIPLLQNFGIYNASLTVKRRGAFPKGGGLVEFTCPIMKKLTPISIIDEGLVKRVRGVAFCSKISPTIITRVIDSCRQVLNHLLPDVYIHSDHFKGKEGGDSPGYSLSLVAESSSGALLSIERTANARMQTSDDDNGNHRPELPEDVGRDGAYMLIEEITKGGVIDRSHQPLILQLMVLTPEDVSKVRFGEELTEQAVLCLQLLRDAFGVVFKIKEDVMMINHKEEEQVERKTLILSCLGIGFTNVNRKVT
eukprot:gene12797-17157_t